MKVSRTISERRHPRPLPQNIACVQPGGGWAVRWEAAWGRVRRWRLRRFRPRYVTRMRARRCGECPGCRHDIIDSRDLKLVRNVCGFWFSPEVDPFRWREALPIARWAWPEVLFLVVPLS